MNHNGHQVKTSSAADLALTLLTLLIVCAGVAIPAQAQTPTVIYNFANGSTNACQPEGAVVQARDGNIYGTAACSAHVFRSGWANSPTKFTVN